MLILFIFVASLFVVNFVFVRARVVIKHPSECIFLEAPLVILLFPSVPLGACSLKVLLHGFLDVISARAIRVSVRILSFYLLNLGIVELIIFLFILFSLVLLLLTDLLTIIILIIRVRSHVKQTLIAMSSGSLHRNIGFVRNVPFGKVALFEFVAIALIVVLLLVFTSHALIIYFV